MLPTYAFLLDTSAWSTFFGGGKGFARVEEVLATREVATSVLSLAELSDIYHRSGHAELWEEDFTFMLAASDVLPVTPDAAARAGATKVRRRHSVPRFGLVDAIILETARAHRTVLLTTDEDFKGMRGVELLPR